MTTLFEELLRRAQARTQPPPAPIPNKPTVPTATNQGTLQQQLAALYQQR